MSDILSLRIEPNFSAWRKQARTLLEHSVHPDTILWADETEAQEDLFGGNGQPVFEGEKQAVSISKEFLDLAKTVACHSDSGRWALLYKMAWRMACHNERHLLKIPTDSDTRSAMEMAKAIRRDCHKMNAFVRFRKVGEDSESGREQFVAWFEPSHHIIQYNAQFFVKRFTGMDWSILSPDECIHWDGKKLHITEGVSKDAAPDSDELEEMWLGYYRSIFNPSRLKLKAMQAEMPKKYWKNLPEAVLIEELTQEAGTRRDEMIDKETLDPKPAPKNKYLSRLREGNEINIVSNVRAALAHEDKSLDEISQLASCCRACPLWERATQTVFGSGNPDAEVMLIGEQPGDLEDIEGSPFVGPAGKLLDEALAQAGLDREQLYITNAVKHFKWKPSPDNNKRRLHDNANRGEVEMCKPWLVAEVLKVRPRIIITLGNTAAQAVIDPEFKVLKGRGKVYTENLIEFSGGIVATVHPSWLLRKSAMTQNEMDGFVADLRLAVL